jgi:hypothetical protein
LGRTSKLKRATFGLEPDGSSVTWAPHCPVSLNVAGATQTPLLAPPTLRKIAEVSARFSAVPFWLTLNSSIRTAPLVMGWLRASSRPMANRLRPTASSELACTAVSSAPLARGLTSGLALVGAAAGALGAPGAL